MQLWMLAVGAAVVGLAVYDAITTTLAASTAAGPVTARIGGGLWQLMRRVTWALRSAGIPVVDDEEFWRRLEQQRDRRRSLFGFATGSTWPWEAAVEAPER